MMNEEPRWEQQGYALLKDLVPVLLLNGSSGLRATFQNGDVAEVEAPRLLRTEYSAIADWSTVCFVEDEAFEFSVQTPKGPIEIPAERIRRLTDVEYDAFLLRREAELPPPGPVAVGLRLYILRQQLGLTAKEVAQRAGITPRSLSRIELARHDVAASTVQKLLIAMGCRWADLDDAVLAKGRPRKRGRGRPPREAA